MNNSWNTGIFFRVANNNDGSPTLLDELGFQIPLEWLYDLYQPEYSTEEYNEDRKEYFRELEENRLKDSDIEITPRYGYVYAVVCGNKLKLGRTLSPKNRFRAYQKVTDNFRLIVQKQVEDYISEERQLMEAFGGVAGKSEWFDYTEDMESRVVKYFTELVGIKNE